MGRINMEEQRTKEDAMIRIQTATDMIQSLYQVPLMPLTDRKTTEEICQKYRFHPIQYYFNEKVLEMVRLNLEEKILYYISDAFRVSFILFSIDGVSYMLGPYMEQQMTKLQIQKLLDDLSLSTLDKEAVNVYLGSFAFLSEDTASKIVDSFIRIVNPKEKHKEIRRIQSDNSVEKNQLEVSKPSKQHQFLVERRYAIESQFMEAIRLGDEREAINYLHQLRKEVSYLTEPGSSMEGYRIGAAITRTMARIVALQSGLPSYLIDRISSLYQTGALEIKTAEALNLATDQMVRDFCTAIRELQANKHSALVLNVLYRLHHEYDSEISVGQIAAEMNLSEGYLVSCFKKEVGMTPNHYLLKYRMQVAAMLLHSGSQSISGISSRIGIADANYFVKVFKKEFGETPSDYRKHHTS